MAIEATINGKTVELRNELTVLEFLASHGLKGRKLAVAHNGNVVTEDQYDFVTIFDGDILEIVRPVGGG